MTSPVFNKRLTPRNQDEFEELDYERETDLDLIFKHDLFYLTRKLDVEDSDNNDTSAHYDVLNYDDDVIQYFNEFIRHKSEIQMNRNIKNERMINRKMNLRYKNVLLKEKCIEMLEKNLNLKQMLNMKEKELELSRKLWSNQREELYRSKFNELNDLFGQLKDTNDDLENERRHTNELRKEIAHLKQVSDELIINNENYKQNISVLCEEIDNLKSMRNKDMEHAELERLQSNELNENVLKENELLKQNIEIFKNYYDDLLNKDLDLIEDLNRHISKLEEEKFYLTEDLELIMKKIELVENELDEYKNENDELRDRLENLATDNENLKTAIIELENKKSVCDKNEELEKVNLKLRKKLIDIDRDMGLFKGSCTDLKARKTNQKLNENNFLMKENLSHSNIIKLIENLNDDEKLKISENNKECLELKRENFILKEKLKLFNLFNSRINLVSQKIKDKNEVDLDIKVSVNSQEEEKIVNIKVYDHELYLEIKSHNDTDNVTSSFELLSFLEGLDSFKKRSYSFENYFKTVNELIPWLDDKSEIQSKLLIQILEKFNNSRILSRYETFKLAFLKYENIRFKILKLYIDNIGEFITHVKLENGRNFNLKQTNSELCETIDEIFNILDRDKFINKLIFDQVKTSWKALSQIEN